MERSAPPPHDAHPTDAGGLTRRTWLGWSLAALPLGLWWHGQVRAQGFSQAPLVPSQAADDPEHPFWRDLRNEFPIEPGHVHFDVAGVGTPPFASLDAMQNAERQAAGTGSGLDPSWNEALRKRLAAFLHCEPESVLLACDDVTAMGRIADALPLPRGTRVILSTHEVPASMAPWVSLAREGRIEIRMVECGDDPRTVLNGVRSAFETGSVLVIPHVLPTTGALMPLEELRDLAHHRGGTIIVQGSQAIGMQEVDLSALQVDAYVAATHGWLLGPVGVAFAAVHPDRIPSLVPRPAMLDVRTPEYVVQRPHQLQSIRDLEGPGLNAGLTAATVASLEWLSAFGIEPARRYATSLTRELHAGLERISGIEALTSAADAAAMPIVAFRVTRRPNTQVAAWLLETMGMRVHRLDNDNINAVRVSPGLCNRPEEVRYLLRGAQSLA